MIKNITLSEIYNSCKEKTIKISLKTENGIFSASTPSGTSTGANEAKTLEIEKIKKIFPKIKKNFVKKDEKDVDKIIEKIGIENVGANFSTALSIASIKALTKNDSYKFFKKQAKIFPFPLGNTIGGGHHGGYMSEQEFLVIPLKARTIKQAIETNLHIWEEIGKTLEPFLLGRNRENAWVLKLNDLKALEILTDLAGDFGASVGIDFAADSIYNGNYYYKHPDRNFTAENQLDFVLDLVKTYKLVYVEDPFEENDFEHLAELTKKANCLVTGDDYFVTQPSRLEMGIKMKAGNAIIIKPNQVGTISKTLATVNIAKRANYATVVSHRSCETNDIFIADLAVGIEAPIIKCGIYGEEREVKLKRLAEIWNETDKPEMAKMSL